MRKKVLIIHHSSVIGGAGISLLNFIELLQNKYTVKVYVSDLHSDICSLYTSKGIDVETYSGRIAALYYHASSGGVMTKSFWHRLVEIPLQTPYWRRILRNEDADLVVFNSLILSWMSTLVVKSKAKSLCFVRETFAQNGRDFISNIQRRFLSKCDAVSFITSYDKDVAALPSSVQSFVNHNVYEPQVVSTKTDAMASDDTIFKVLYLGGVSSLKGIEVLVDAARLLKNDSQIHFDILGEDFKAGENSKYSASNQNYVLAQKVRATIEKESLTNITIHGVHQDVSTFFQKCNVLVCSLTNPHQQRGIFEAGWFGKPVIVSDFEQLHWAAIDGYNGELFTPGDALSLATKIRKLYDSKELCELYGANNKELTLKNHEKERCNEKVLGMVEDILNG